MNTKALLPLVAGLAVAGLAGKLGFDYLQRARGAQTEMVPVVAAAQEIPLGVALEERMLRTVSFPRPSLPPGAFTDPSKLVGRVPRIIAPANLPILESMLLPPGATAGLWVPPGYRAVAVKIDESSGVDNHLQPGCRVDVVGFYSIRKGNQSQTIARTLIENVEVGAVGPRLAPTVSSEDGAGKGKTTRPDKPARAVTLFVKPEHVPLLHLAEQRGKIKLCMRNSDDSAATSRLAKAVEDQLLGDAPPEEPSAGAAPADPLGGLIAGWIQKLSSTADRVLETPAGEPAATEPPAPSLAWVMTVWNGNDRRTVGWTEMDSTEPVEVGQDAGAPPAGPTAPRARTPRTPRPGPSAPASPGTLFDPPDESGELEQPVLEEHPE